MPQPTVFVEPVTALERPNQEEIMASRRGFLALSAVACGSALLMGAVPAQSMGYGDQRRLRFLEEAERLEKEFFGRAAQSGTADGLTEREANVLNLIAKQDAEHASWLLMAAQKFGVGTSSRTESGARESSRPALVYTFPASLYATRGAFYVNALSIKETVVGTYHNLLGEISDPKMVEAVAALAGVEGRHLAMLRDLTGEDPFVGFENTFTTAEASRRLRKFGFAAEII